MKYYILYAFILALLSLLPRTAYPQAPNLGTTSTFALFTAAGAFNNNGTTTVVGDIGTNIGAFSGFPPGIVAGQIHVADPVTAQAAVDVDAAYMQLDGLPCGAVIGTTLGNNQTLMPNIYCLGAASVINGDLILDGQCDPNALFIFQIDGALSTNVSARVILINSASICNVYWQVNGAFSLGDNSVFRGTLIGNGAISLLQGSSLLGRGLSRAGAIELHTNVVNIDTKPTASNISANGPSTFCVGDSVVLTGNCGGTWNTGSTVLAITVKISGDYFVTNINSCGSSVSNHIQVIANPVPVCSINGLSDICEGQSTNLCSPPGAASYLWNTGAVTNCILVRDAGVYSVTVLDLNGCSSTCTRTVTTIPIPVCTISGNSVICDGQSTELCSPSGSASYLWSTGQTTSCIHVSLGGNFLVTVTDASGCSSVCNKVVSLLPLPSCNISGNATFCEGQSTELCAPSGSASYLWSTGETTNCITVSVAGNFIVTVTSMAGCINTCSIVVNELPLPVCSISGNAVICTGQSTELCSPVGSASYLWNTGQTNNCIIVSVAGTYSVTVTDALGCMSICSKVVTILPAPVCTISGNAILCEGQSTELCAPAGASNYLWSTGQTTNCIIVNSAGNYSVVVTDAAGCSSTCNKSVIIIIPPACNISGSNFICVGQSIPLCVPAGSYAYIWNTGQTTNCISINSAGNYTVTITDALGCTSSCAKQVTSSPLPICNITGKDNFCTNGEQILLCATTGAFSYLWNTGETTSCINIFNVGIYAVTITNAAGCNSSCSKTIYFQPLPDCVISGDEFICQAGQNIELCTPPGSASYHWSNGKTTNCITINTAGTYLLTITDASGCTSTCSKTVSLNPFPFCQISGLDFICAEGQEIQLCVPAGASSYLWNTDAMTNCIMVSWPGKYEVSITNANGCVSKCSKTIIITPFADCQILGSNSICSGQPSQLCASPIGLNYLWSTGQTSGCIEVINAGTYTLTVTNTNGCTSVCEKNMLNAISPDCTIPGNNVICEGFTTTFCAPEGAVSYLWNNGMTSQCITISTPANYKVTVTSASGCSSICSKTAILNPLPICDINGKNSICQSGQNIKICSPPGIGTYIWNTGQISNCISIDTPGTFTVTVTSALGCLSVCSKTIFLDSIPDCTISGDGFICELGQATTLCAPTGAKGYLWSTGQKTNCITVNLPGTYIVTVTNFEGCSSSCSKVVSLYSSPTCIITGGDIICLEGQSISLCTPSGAISYQWNTGQNTNCIAVNLPGSYSVTITHQNGCISTCTKIVSLNTSPTCTIIGDTFICDTLKNIILCTPTGAQSYLWNTGHSTNCISINLPGTYSVSVTNMNGCVSICSKNVVFNPLPYCLITGDAFICGEGKSSTLCVPTGATSYLWSNGQTTNCIQVNTPGNYSVTITHANGCVSACVQEVVLNPTPACSISGDEIICGIGRSAALCVPEGAAAYWWNTNQTERCIDVSLPGTYSITVTNTNGCISKCSKIVLLDSLVQCNITGDDLICEEGGLTTLCASVGAKSYHWNTGDTTHCLSVSLPGLYSLTTTNSNGCINTCDRTVIRSAGSGCIITGNNFICNGEATLLCAPSSCAAYKWSNGDTTSCIIVRSSGLYSVTITGMNGCVSICSLNVLDTSARSCIISGITTVCEGQPTLLCAPSGCSEYLWNNGARTGCILAKNPGIYSVTITNKNGCSSICSVMVTLEPSVSCLISGKTTVCEGQPTLLCAPPGCVEYRWNTGARTSCIMASLPGMYSVSLTNGNGCISTCCVSVSETQASTCLITGNQIICPGQPTLLCAPDGCAQYSWSTGDTTNCIIARIAGMYSVTVFNANGCTTSCCMEITESQAPNCLITGNTKIENGKSTLLCAPANYVSYLWNTGDTSACVLIRQAGKYTVTVTGDNGCSSSCCVEINQAQSLQCLITGVDSICMGHSNLLCGPTGCISYLWNTGDTTSCILIQNAGNYSLSVKYPDGSIKICSLLVVEKESPPCLISGNNSICQGQSSELCVIETQGATYLWNTGQTTRCIIIDSAGTYSVTVTLNACQRTCSFNVGKSQNLLSKITGNLYPKKGKITTLCAPSDQRFYLWNTGATTSCIEARAGYYSVVVTNTNGCISTGTAHVRQTASDINWVAKDQSFLTKGVVNINIYPNPFKDYTNIEFHCTSTIEKLTIELYSINGKRIAVLFDHQIYEGNSYSVVLNSEHLPEGIYICKVIHGDEIVNKKVLLIR